MLSAKSRPFLPGGDEFIKWYLLFPGANELHSFLYCLPEGPVSHNSLQYLLAVWSSDMNGLQYVCTGSSQI